MVDRLQQKIGMQPIIRAMFDGLTDKITEAIGSDKFIKMSVLLDQHKYDRALQVLA